MIGYVSGQKKYAVKMIKNNDVNSSKSMGNKWSFFMFAYGNTILAFILVAVLLPTDKSKIDLPTYTSLKVVKTIYEYPRKRKSCWFGDGYYGKIVRVTETEMGKFISNFKQLDDRHQWSQGNLIKYKLHLEVLEYIEKCIKQTIGDKELEILNKAVNLKKLKQNKNIYHRIEYRRNNDGFIRDAEIWILVPAKNMVCIFSNHT